MLPESSPSSLVAETLTQSLFLFHLKCSFRYLDIQIFVILPFLIRRFKIFKKS